MFKSNINVYFLLVFFSVLTISCGNKKKLIYFQGAIENSTNNRFFAPTLQVDDIVSILITDFDQEAVKPFNLPQNSTSAIGGAGYSTGMPAPPGYLIAPDSTVDFPIIGKIKIAGLNREETIKLLKDKLNPYLKNPSVQLRILNFKITVLGEVRNPGTFTIPNERINILEAIGLSGDLLISGIRKNVLVIRNIDGVKKEFRVDLTSNKLFSSPVFYLIQNDIVYVEPNRAKINSSTVNTTNIGLIVSVMSLLVTMTVLLIRN
jgi:polysaccharide export outer membrane protein